MKQQIIKIVFLLSFIDITAHAAATNACMQQAAMDIVAPNSWLEQGMTRAEFEFTEGVVKLTDYKANSKELEAVRLHYQNSVSKTSQFRNSAESFPELEDAEVMAIIDYSGGGYRIMNTPFKETVGIKNSDVITQQKIKVLASALNKSKNKFKGIAVRGATLGDVDIEWLIDRMNKRLPIYSKAFWSSGRRAAGGFSRNVRFEIRSRTGVYIKSISNYPSEEEVLFNPGVPFRIESVDRTSVPGKTVVKLTELITD